MEIKPLRVFYLFVLVGAIFIGLSFIIPQDGVTIGWGFKLKWLAPSDFLPFQEALVPPAQNAQSAAVVLVPDTIEMVHVANDSVICDTIKTVHNNLIFNNSGKASLFRFFERLNRVDSTGRPLHILHFGDSQLDGDRISRFLRVLFQTKFGGSGCGLVGCLDPVKQVSSVWIDSKGDWSTQWVYDESRRANSLCFGLLGNKSMALVNDDASVMYTPSPVGEHNCRNYRTAKLFVTSSTSKQIVTCYADRALYQIDTVQSSTIQSLDYSFPYPPRRLEFTFSGNQTPYLNGCLLDGIGGVQVDNIALRGQLFTRFLQRDSILVSEMVSKLDVGLVILQFGANLLPTKADNYHFYVQQIEQQIGLIKKFIPKAAIMVIGVGDAAERINGQLETLSSVRPIAVAQELAAMHMGACYFDLFTAMGGAGTIVKWADSDPKMALTDYIHYNQLGGKQVANLIFNSIEAEYQLWVNQLNSKQL